MKTTTKEIEITRNTMAGGKAVKIGQKITLPTQEAQFLIHIGKARAVVAAQAAAEQPAKNKAPAAGGAADLGKMKVDQLKELAAAEGVKLAPGAKKADIVKAVEAALAAKAGGAAETTEETETDADGAGEGDQG